MSATTSRVFACLLVLAGAGSGWAQSNEGGTASDRANEQKIRQLYEEFEATWNRHDPTALSNFWAIDGDHLEPDGTRAKGRATITRMLARQHETVFKDSELDLSIEDVWFLGGGDIALIDGSYLLSGVQTPDGTKLPPRKGHLTSVLLHEGGRWWIVASRLMIPAPLPYKRT